MLLELGVRNVDWRTLNPHFFLLQLFKHYSGVLDSKELNEGKVFIGMVVLVMEGGILPFFDDSDVLNLSVLLEGVYQYCFVTLSQNMAFYHQTRIRQVHFHP